MVRPLLSQASNPHLSSPVDRTVVHLPHVFLHLPHMKRSLHWPHRLKSSHVYGLSSKNSSVHSPLLLSLPPPLLPPPLLLLLLRLLRLPPPPPLVPRLFLLL